MEITTRMVKALEEISAIVEREKSVDEVSVALLPLIARIEETLTPVMQAMKNEGMLSTTNTLSKYPPHAIVRRIDDLGRVVVNRGIRRALNLREGEPIAMWTEGSRIIMERYSELTPYVEEAGALADVISRRTGSICVISNRSEIIAAAGSSITSKQVGARIGSAIHAALAEVMDFYWRVEDGGEAREYALADGTTPTLVEEIYVCLIKKELGVSEAIGAIIIFRPGSHSSSAIPSNRYVREHPISDTDKALATLAAEILLSKVDLSYQ